MFEEKDEKVAPMVLSVNLCYKPCLYEICLVENGCMLEHVVWETISDVIVYVTQITARYPPLLLALVTDQETDLCSLADLAERNRQQDEQEQDRCLFDFLQAMRLLAIKGVHLPAIKYAPNVPLYRQRFFATMGLPRTLCALATLLYRMRQQNADWTEMTFFYLELHHMSYTLVVVKDGSIVDGETGNFAVQIESESLEQTTQLLALAFWERLTHDLAGLSAIHHIEDIVLYDCGNDAGDENMPRDQRKRLEEAIDRLGDSYKLYQFPQDESEQAGREIVFGAALLTEGFLRAGHAVELAQRLISMLFVPL
jgi:predicted butyrate kinase (DUF1464 family)